MKREYYTENEKYSKLLNKGKFNQFETLTNFVIKKLKQHDTYLDVGCGTGIVVEGLKKRGIDAYGIEVSKSSFAIAVRRQGRYRIYNGREIPFKDNYFDAVGSFNVIEHVESVDQFLNESKRVLKPGGYLIICAPNFMSLTNSFHHTTSGITRRISNLTLFLVKLLRFWFGTSPSFSQITPIIQKDFHPDDDATNLMNPLDLFIWGQANHMKLIEYSGSILSKEYLSHYLGKIPVLNLFTGGVFIVFQK